MPVPAAAVLLKRRRIGTVAILLGVIGVVASFMIPLISPTSTAGQSVAQTGTGAVDVRLPGSTTAMALPLPSSGSNTGLGLLLHTFGRPLLSANLGSTVVDIAARAGIVLMALAALLCVVFTLLPLTRGFVGIAAGLGLFGTAVELGVLLGERARTLSLCTGSVCQVDLHAGIWLAAAGFALALVGGAFSALRPLAGLFSGVGFAIGGAVLGAGLAFLIATVHVLDVTVSSLPH